MPGFDYTCNDCSHRWYYLSGHEEAPDGCPACKSNYIQREIGFPSVKFIGPGFHQTDYNETHDWEGTDYDTNMRENEKQNERLGLDES